MRIIHVEVMDIGEEAYLVDDIEYGTVKKMNITGVRVCLEGPLGKPSVSYRVGEFGYSPPDRVFKTAKEAFDVIESYQMQTS
jgi:hypothetical protein